MQRISLSRLWPVAFGLLTVVGLVAERSSPTRTDSSILPMGGDLPSGEAGMLVWAGFYGSVITLVVLAWRKEMGLRLLLALVSVIVSTIAIATAWPSPTAYVHHEWDYPQRPWPFTNVDVEDELQERRESPERLAIALAPYSAGSLNALDVYQVMAKLGLNPGVIISEIDPPRLMTLTSGGAIGINTESMGLLVVWIGHPIDLAAVSDPRANCGTVMPNALLDVRTVRGVVIVSGDCDGDEGRRQISGLAADRLAQQLESTR